MNKIVAVSVEQSNYLGAPYHQINNVAVWFHRSKNGVDCVANSYWANTPRKIARAMRLAYRLSEIAYIEAGGQL